MRCGCRSRTAASTSSSAASCCSGASRSTRRSPRCAACCKPGGFFAFSTFGLDTLHELRSAWAAADGYNHVNHFPDVHEVGDALLRAGLTEPVLDVDRLELAYPDVLALMRDLKAIGAHNVTAGRPRSARRPRAARARARPRTSALRRDVGLPATWEVIYGASWGAAGRRGRAGALGRRAYRARIDPAGAAGERARTLRHRHRHRASARPSSPVHSFGRCCARRCRGRGDEADRLRGRGACPPGCATRMPSTSWQPPEPRLPTRDVNPYCFEPPISPHIAAEDSKITIDIGMIVATLPAARGRRRLGRRRGGRGVARPDQRPREHGGPGGRARAAGAPGGGPEARLPEPRATHAREHRGARRGLCRLDRQRRRPADAAPSRRISPRSSALLGEPALAVVAHAPAAVRSLAARRGAAAAHAAADKRLRRLELARSRATIVGAWNPNRCASRSVRTARSRERGARLFFAAACVVPIGIAGVLAYKGFWPVLPFAGLEMALLGVGAQRLARAALPPPDHHRHRGAGQHRIARAQPLRARRVPAALGAG